MTVRATIPVGEAPRKIALLPGDGMASMAGMPGMTTMAAPAASTGSQQAAPSASAVPGDVEIQISKFSFGGPVTIKAGQTVSWLNNDAVTHTVEAPDGSWDLGEVAPGQRVARTFDAPGTFDYYCDFHEYMRSQVVVQ
jgi:plastocyanin